MNERFTTETSEIERDLQAGLQLLHEFASAGFEPAAQILEHVHELLFAPMQPQRGDLPHRDIEWPEQRTGRGGRRSTADYRDLASAYGFRLHRDIGWTQARDAARAIQQARHLVDGSHVNILLSEEGW